MREYGSSAEAVSEGQAGARLSVYVLYDKICLPHFFARGVSASSKQPWKSWNRRRDVRDDWSERIGSISCGNRRRNWEPNSIDQAPCCGGWYEGERHINGDGGKIVIYLFQNYKCLCTTKTNDTWRPDDNLHWPAWRKPTRKINTVLSL